MALRDMSAMRNAARVLMPRTMGSRLASGVAALQATVGGGALATNFAADGNLRAAAITLAAAAGYGLAARMGADAYDRSVERRTSEDAGKFLAHASALPESATPDAPSPLGGRIGDADWQAFITSHGL